MLSNYIKRNFRLLVGAPILLVLILAACFSSFLAPEDPFKIDTKNILKGPSRQHPFGTDQIGRDVLKPDLYGRLSDQRSAAHPSPIVETSGQWVNR